MHLGMTEIVENRFLYLEVIVRKILNGNLSIVKEFKVSFSKFNKKVRTTKFLASISLYWIKPNFQH